MRTVAEFAREGADFSVSLESEAEVGSLPCWMELLVDGLTFDLVGLAPGPAAAEPPQAHRYGLPECREAARVEAVTLTAGPHLAAGARMVPAVRSLARLTAHLALLPGVRAVAWHPARIRSAPERFCADIARWFEGGEFPALSLAALASTPDGGMHSEGMTLFCGQELRLEPELTGDRVMAAKTARILLAWLVERAPLDRAENVAGPGNIPVRLEPSANGRFVRAWRG